MKVTLKLFASLAVHLPPELRSRLCMEVEVPLGTTVVGLIRQQGVPEAQCAIVLLDGVWVAQADRAGSVLQEGQALAIWPPVAGG
jgi:sulfur carrier protein ThiS